MRLPLEALVVSRTIRGFLAVHDISCSSEIVSPLRAMQLLFDWETAYGVAPNAPG